MSSGARRDLTAPTEGRWPARRQGHRVPGSFGIAFAEKVEIELPTEEMASAVEELGLLLRDPTGGE